MLEYTKRMMIVIGMAICITLLFLGANVSHAQENVVDLDWIWPVKEGTLTDQFGTRNGHHYGIDIAAEQGTPVFAAADGKVRRSYFSSSYGNVVFVTHENGMETVYAHLNRRLVTEGKKVKQGEPIGEVGSTGRSSGNHLHFEVHNGSWNVEKTFAIDPLLLFKNESPHQGKEKTMTAATEKVSDNDRNDKLVITIEKGDTLWGFSLQYGVSISKLKEWNGLDSSLIVAGDQLVIYANAL